MQKTAEKNSNKWELHKTFNQTLTVEARLKLMINLKKRTTFLMNKNKIILNHSLLRVTYIDLVIFVSEMKIMKNGGIMKIT